MDNFDNEAFEELSRIKEELEDREDRESILEQTRDITEDTSYKEKCMTQKIVSNLWKNCLTVLVTIFFPVILAFALIGEAVNLYVEVINYLREKDKEIEND